MEQIGEYLHRNIYAQEGFGVVKSNRFSESKDVKSESGFLSRVLQSFAIYYFYIVFCCGWSLISIMYPFLVSLTSSQYISYAFIVRSLSGIVGATLEPFLLDFFACQLGGYGGINLKIILTIFLLATSHFLLPFVPRIYFTFLCIGIEGFVFGMMLCAMTIYLKYIWGGRTNRLVAMILHALHVMNGIAGTLYPLYCARVIRSDLSEQNKLRVAYVTISILLATSAIPFLFFQIKRHEDNDSVIRNYEVPSSTSKEEDFEKGKRSFRFCFRLLGVKKVFRVKTGILASITVAVHFGQAVLLNDLGALTYYIVKKGYADQAGAQVYYSAFFASIMVLRVFLVPVLLLAYSFGLWSCLLMWWFGGYSRFALWVGVIFQGLCSAPTFSPYFVLPVEKFGFGVPNAWVSIFTYVVFFSWFYPTLAIKLCDINPDWFIIMQTTFFAFDLFWNALVIFGGSCVYKFKYHNEKEKKETEK